MAMAAMHSVEPFADSTPLLGDPDRLRERARDQGYLFFRGLIDPLPLLSLRRQVLEVCRSHGWLDEDSPLADGVVKKGICYVESRDRPEWKAFYCDVQKLRDFHALALQPPLLEMFEALFGEQVLPHSRNICRVIFPATETYTTPPHQDHFPIGGTRDTWTAWIPLGDCPPDLGGVAVAPGSHRRGFLEVHPAMGAGGPADFAQQLLAFDAKSDGTTDMADVAVHVLTLPLFPLITIITIA